jgi:hypothetical protein
MNSRTSATPLPRYAWTILAALLAFGVAAVAMVYFVDPAHSSLYPRCALLALTGLYCPGCGGLRATHALLHGDLQKAIALNPLVAVLPPIALMIAAAWAIDRNPRRVMRFFTSLRWYVTLPVFVLLFGLLRNLPVYPFTLLAPH